MCPQGMIWICRQALVINQSCRTAWHICGIGQLFHPKECSWQAITWIFLCCFASHVPPLCIFWCGPRVLLENTHVIHLTMEVPCSEWGKHGYVYLWNCGILGYGTTCGETIHCILWMLDLNLCQMVLFQRIVPQPTNMFDISLKQTMMYYHCIYWPRN